LTGASGGSPRVRGRLPLDPRLKKRLDKAPGIIYFAWHLFIFRRNRKKNYLVDSTPESTYNSTVKRLRI